MMKIELELMLRGACPQCKSRDDVITYLPVVQDDSVHIELECENCGCAASLECKLLSFDLSPSIQHTEQKKEDSKGD